MDWPGNYHAAPLVQIWNNDLSISLLHSADMRPYNWSYTQFSQFNQDDSLLLASGVFLGPHNSSSGEIAVISLGECGHWVGLPAPPCPACWQHAQLWPSSQTPSPCCPVCETSPMMCLAAGSQKPASFRGTCTALEISPPVQCCGSTMPSRFRLGQGQAGQTDGVGQGNREEGAGRAGCGRAGAGPRVGCSPGLALWPAPTCCRPWLVSL